VVAAVALQNEPAGQVAHAVWPALAWYVPVGQEVHEEAPLAAETVPAPQSEQADWPATANFPALQPALGTQ